MCNLNTFNNNSLSPLRNFRWNGTEFTLSDSFEIQRISPLEELLKIGNNSQCLSEIDIDYYIKPFKYWLIIKHRQDITPEDQMNIFLIALWIIIPSRVTINFRFSLNHNNKTYGFARVCDNFQHNLEHTECTISNENLRAVTKIIPQIEKIYLQQKRLHTSLYLTYSGCTQKNWQTAFICYSVAIESLLNYGNRKSLTANLAFSNACLVEPDNRQRHISYKKFKKLYDVRSIIMHGKERKKENSIINLENLASFSNILRKLWLSILKSDEIINTLEQKNSIREKFFTELQKNYQTPVNNFGKGY